MNNENQEISEEVITFVENKTNEYFDIFEQQNFSEEEIIEFLINDNKEFAVDYKKILICWKIQLRKK